VVEMSLFVVLVLHQCEVSSLRETTASDADIPVEETDCEMQRVNVLSR